MYMVMSNVEFANEFVVDEVDVVVGFDVVDDE